jgi:hypothetical protein
VLHIFGAGHAPRIHRQDLPPASGDLRIELDAGARVQGRVLPADLARKLTEPWICLQSLADERQFFPHPFGSATGHGHVGHVERNGSFVIEHVPSGDWRVCLGYILHVGERGLYQVRSVGELRGLLAGKTRTLDLDCAAAAPVAAGGYALFRGEPARFARLTCAGSGTSFAVQPLRGGLECDENGRIEGHLAPGRYRVHGMLHDPRSGELLPCVLPVPLVVAPGAEFRQTLDLVLDER